MVARSFCSTCLHPGYAFFHINWCHGLCLIPAGDLFFLVFLPERQENFLKNGDTPVGSFFK